MNRTVLGPPLVLAALASTSDAQALGPIGVEAGLQAGAATSPGLRGRGVSSEGPNAYGFGLGVRAGVSLFDVYVGASAIHYFGSSVDTGGINTQYARTNSGSLRASSTLLGGQFGYTVTQLKVVHIRPQLGVGNANIRAELSTGGATYPAADDGDHLYLEPGVTVLVPLDADVLFVGIDANALILPSVDTATGSKTSASFSMHAQFGVRF